MAELITVLGASGSIGVSTLDVIARHPERYQVFALTGNSRVDVLAEQSQRHRPRYVVTGSRQAAAALEPRVPAGCRVLWGEEALAEVAAHADVDTVMAAIVGAAGLLPTLAAARAGKKVLLANKESLVMAGDLFMAAMREGGGALLPIDSEHNAIFQCLPTGYRDAADAGVSHILLSASGGPFRTRPLDSFDSVTPDQACAHPNWAMGRKISVDSATMMNKGLELIEACWLFGVEPDRVQVVIHPQSVVHSLVAYVDGSVLAQLGNPDMRTPIAHALAWPERIASGVAPLDLMAVARLDFEAPDPQRFPCLALAADAVRSGGDYPAALNAANEVAVAAFLDHRLSFTAIAKVVEAVLNDWSASEPCSIAAVQHADRTARQLAQTYSEAMAL
ncbi:MAG: 1-deoxy-D-xylulose-5-phosphate reductoisomerase [Porticoccaceae bacterium]|nr:1-deoxy-D-xylulose-5-phosphate reductoisomerase [Porticoccaceae bacterium]